MSDAPVYPVGQAPPAATFEAIPEVTFGTQSWFCPQVADERLTVQKTLLVVQAGVAADHVLVPLPWHPVREMLEIEMLARDTSMMSLHALVSPEVPDAVNWFELDVQPVPAHTFTVEAQIVLQPQPVHEPGWRPWLSG